MENAIKTSKSKSYEHVETKELSEEEAANLCQKARSHPSFPKFLSWLMSHHGLPPEFADEWGSLDGSPVDDLQDWERWCSGDKCFSVAQSGLPQPNPWVLDVLYFVE